MLHLVGSSILFYVIDDARSNKNQAQIFSPLCISRPIFNGSAVCWLWSKKWVFFVHSFHENTQAGLSESSCPFLGPSYKLQSYTQSNGKYLIPFKLAEKLDPVMQGHVVPIVKDRVADHLVVNITLNEFIYLMAIGFNL